MQYSRNMALEQRRALTCTARCCCARFWSRRDPGAPASCKGSCRLDDFSTTFCSECTMRTNKRVGLKKGIWAKTTAGRTDNARRKMTTNSPARSREACGNRSS